jgi:hypothetical protein
MHFGLQGINNLFLNERSTYRYESPTLNFNIVTSFVVTFSNTSKQRTFC